MRIMYDSVTPSNILVHDRNPAIVAGYANGRYAWSGNNWDLFPNSRKLRIAVRATEFNAHALDCEVGDATPAECPDWALTRRHAGGFPIIYCNRSTWTQVIAQFNARAIQQPMYWIATASGKQEIPVGAIGAQYLLDWQGVDVSVMQDHIPGLDPESDDMSAQSEDQINQMFHSVSQVYAQTGMDWSQVLINLARLFPPLDHDAIKARGGHDAGSLTNASHSAWENLIFTQGPAIAAMKDALAAATQNPAITPDFITQTIDNAVAKHMQITGTVEITGKE